MKTALVIMAAGLGSRFGSGIKQLTPIGPNGEIIMDYSIHDAAAAGFNKVIIVLRHDIEEDFRSCIGDRIDKVCEKLGVEVNYAFQRSDDIPIPFPQGRTKPWGTVHAVLAARDLITEPFAVINADDYYGKTAYKIIHDFLVNNTVETDFCMAGFIVEKTLSEHGGVTRGICSTDEHGYLTKVVETGNIMKTANGIEADGVSIAPTAHVSMNIWGLTPTCVGMLKESFNEFCANLKNPMKDECLLPIEIDRLLQAGRCTVKLLETRDQWYGVTFAEDREPMIESMRGLVKAGVYSPDLYSDLMK